MTFLMLPTKVKGKLKPPPFTVIGGNHTPKKVKEPENLEYFLFFMSFSAL